MTWLLEARELTKTYQAPGRGLFAAASRVSAVDHVSLAVAAGEVLGIVGESGSGKSTLARLLMALEAPDSGELHWLGERITGMRAASLRPRRRRIQMIFQDPFASLDPRMRILDSVAEPLDVAEPALPVPERAARVARMLERVGLEAGAMTRLPHQFSGGQRQRIAIARALITAPKLVVADEPVSALDVSIQAQILNLLVDLKAELGLSLVFISHDLGIVRYLADRVMVMQQGLVVETGATATVFAAPQHEYTRRLLAAMPRL